MTIRQTCAGIALTLSIVLARPAAACDRSRDPEPFALLASGVALLDVTGTVEDPPGAGLAIAPVGGGAAVAVDAPASDCDAWFAVGDRGRLLVPAGQGLHAGVFVSSPGLLAALAAFTAAAAPAQRAAALIAALRQVPTPQHAADVLVTSYLRDVTPRGRRQLRRLARGTGQPAAAAAYVLARLPSP